MSIPSNYLSQNIIPFTATQPGFGPDAHPADYKEAR